jgi:tetratricopeptide (TPR) repeat protein
MQSISRRFIAGLVCCIVASYVHAQTPDTDLQQVIDEDLQTQAQVETDNGHSQRALALLNELVDRDPRRAGALLDAAVLYCQLGERDLSLETLARIEKGYAVPPAIQKLITFYKNSGCAPTVARPKLSASIGIGTTSNANFGPSSPFVTFAPGAPFAASTLAPESLAHSDQYVESSVQGELPLAMLPSVTLLAGLTDRQYESEHAFDQRTATVGVAHLAALGQGEIGNQLTADLLWLGTNLYQRNLDWHVNYWTAPTAVQSVLGRAGADFTLTSSSYPGNKLYDSIYAELRAAFNARIGDRTTVLLFAGPVWDVSQEGRPGGTRFGYTAWLALDYDMNMYGQLELNVQQRTLNDATPYDPVFFGDVTRRETMRSASLRYAYPLSRGWSVYAQVSTQYVSDSISLFSYTVRNGSVGLTWKY